MTTFVILIALALLWGIVLVPPWIKKRSHRSTSVDALDAFSQRLSRLDRSSTGPGRAPVVPLRPALAPNTRARPPGDPMVAPGPAAGAIPQTPNDARRRRRGVTIALGATAFATLLLAIAAGGAFIVLHLLVDAALLGYVILLVQYQRRLEEVRHKVRPIRPPQVTRPQPSHAALLQRSGS